MSNYAIGVLPNRISEVHEREVPTRASQVKYVDTDGAHIDAWHRIKGSLKLERVSPERHRRIPYLRDALRWMAKGGFLGIALVSLLAMVVLLKARYYPPVPAAALVFVACTLFFVIDRSTGSADHR